MDLVINKQLMAECDKMFRVFHSISHEASSIIVETNHRLLDAHRANESPTVIHRLKMTIENLLRVKLLCKKGQHISKHYLLEDAGQLLIETQQLF
jgi:hypothetical protein